MNIGVTLVYCLVKWILVNIVLLFNKINFGVTLFYGLIKWIWVNSVLQNIGEHCFLFNKISIGEHGLLFNKMNIGEHWFTV